ncbi:DUF775-domain-containing protein [Nadsonia fulvescens var. elongata DSM 6958]|uniref:DUF775-domain-containing protein n=1 Tax=Nadsonia fulvescens var. elongata DSM 6958 TaxID=857566 RepID=A0A1E3PN14_9ASCO|nr:DUF775-domain-containing protein [Nadsonia fulvescens var. elongata DSM 6958]
MFGAICAGRGVQTELQQVDSNKYMLQIEDGAKVNHIVVFLLPGAALEPGIAASVYFQLPGQDFTLLGALSNNKPSAIFKINQGANVTLQNDSLDEMSDVDAGVPPITITVGISLEPIEVVEASLAELRNSRLLQQQQKQTVSSPVPTSTALVRPSENPTAALANKIVRHAYNFLSGFATTDGKVPMKAFDDWWLKFRSKLVNNPNFLENLE